MAKVTITLDQQQTELEINPTGDSILNAALDAGLDAPYSCKGGVCTTCKAKLLEGKVRMDANYALTDREVADGYILVCQSHPDSEKVHFTWDV
jgi:ring-1,2-phenylacetyl-CoA epoxidase subunit PaaE